MTGSSVDYAVLTATGAPMKTFDDRDAAIDYAQEARKTFPGCYVEEVVTTVTRTVLYRSRPGLRIVRAA